MTETDHRAIILRDAVMRSTTLSIESYYILLQNHDWYYAYSDSFRVVDAGEQAIAKLESIANSHTEFRRLLDAYKAHKFSGPDWDSVQSPVPVLADFESVEAQIQMPVVSEHGILIGTCSEYSQDNDVWDKTSHEQGHCIVREIDGQMRSVGVFPSRSVAVQCAQYAVSCPEGGYDDVVIENVSVYTTFDEWL